MLDQCQEYRKRRDALCNGLREAGWPVEDSQGTMFVFAKLPKRWEGCSAAFCEALVDACGVVCTPGAAFGSLGEGYVRFALVRPPQELARIAQYIGDSGCWLKGCSLQRAFPGEEPVQSNRMALAQMDQSFFDGKNSLLGE